MHIAVIGGTGLIGSRVVDLLTTRGHRAVPHSPSTGLDVLSGRGLAEALRDAGVVVNLTNSPTFDDALPATPVQPMAAAGMFAAVRGDALLPRPGAVVAPTRFRDWSARVGVH